MEFQLVLHAILFLDCCCFAGSIVFGDAQVTVSLTDPIHGHAGWSVFVVFMLKCAGLAIMEATVQGNVALAGDLEKFAMSYSLSRGVELLFILFPSAFLAITLVDLRSPSPLTPRWSS